MFSWGQYEPFVCEEGRLKRICKNSIAFNEFGVSVESSLLQMCDVIVKMRE